jgi:adenosine deaminase
MPTMKKKNLIVIMLLVVIIGACKNNLRAEANGENELITGKYFDTMKANKDNAQMLLFFSMMPKGGDIHHHYSGAIYAETYLDWASTGYCIKTDSLILKPCTKPCSKCISIDSLKKNTALYRSVLETWSDLNYSDHFHLQDQPDQHFFNTFSYFGTISGSNYRAGLAEIKNRARTENVQYIETMLSSPDTKVTYRQSLIDSMVYFGSVKDTINLPLLFNSLVKSIQSTPSYNTIIANFIDSIYSYHKNIDDTNFTMKFQAYASRGSKPDAVFTKLYSCFDAATRDKSSLLVGVNIVGPENGIVAMNDYWLHMQMFKYLKHKFPTVKTSMHAGELAMGLVKPEDLTYHIREAVYSANASRIGHGIDIPYEKEPLEILHKMKESHIAVEINLTSNEFILGIKNNDHPINLYYQAGVPIVISTDDAGVSRNNLTTEYVKLASRYNFTYKQIKSFVFNSIQYAFLSETEKAALLKKLAIKFQEFEAKIASTQSQNQ